MTNMVVVGSLIMDLVVRTPHLPAPGETVLGGDFLHERAATPPGSGNVYQFHA